MVQEANHYEILNVPEDASSEDIKKAYRKLSLKYHPDRNPGKPEVVDIFQKINNAYEVLGSAEKKAEYDMMRRNPFSRGMGNGGMNMGVPTDIDELLKSMFFGGMPNAGGLPGMCGFPQGMFTHHMGQGGGGGGPMFQMFHNGMPVNLGPQKPQPIVKTLPVSMELVLSGGTVPMEIERWIIENGNKTTETQTIYVNISKGVDNNEIIVLENQGNIASPQCKGDVKVFIKIENDTEFQRRGLDLLLERHISLKDSLCGFSFDMKYINGKIYTINNNRGNIIHDGYQKVLPNLGLSRDDHTGNLVILFHVDYPSSLTEEQITIISNTLS